MKLLKLKYRVFIVLSICLAGVFTACDEQNELELPYLFRPVNFNVEMNKTVATFSWAKTDMAVSYTLQVSADSVEFSAPVIDTTITELSFVYELPGRTQFYARLRANAETEEKNSKFNLVSFKTPAENIFEGYTSLMTHWQEITVKWRPGANVTHLLLTAADATTHQIDLTPEDKTAGAAKVAALQNSLYKVEVFNGTTQRGQVSVLVEGDVYVSASDDIVTVLDNAAEGSVVVLEPGALFRTGSSTYRISKNLKLKGASPNQHAIISMTEGTPTTTSSMLGFAENSVIAYVKFENIDFTGYCDNNSSGTKIGYLFNNNVMTAVSNLSFENCKLHNYGNTPMRVQGNKNQVIDTLVFNKCTIYDVGFSSTYAVVNSNSADLINNITFSNSTVYKFRGSLILRQNQQFNSISILNCTINQGMQDAGSTRFLIDANNATVNGSGIAIRNSLFGQAGSPEKGAAGIRTTGNVLIVGSHYCSDFYDETLVGDVSYSKKSLMTLYSAKSTDLWNDPLSGNFSLKDISFTGKGAAGDLRWY